jgi:hypothetical protein
VDSTWAGAYLRHFKHFFGKPFDIQTFHSVTGIPLRLATYDLRYKKFRVYASLGMADEADGDAGEVILLSDDLTKDVPYIFVNSLFFILDKSIALGNRFAVGGVDSLKPDFAEYYDKAAIYYTLATGFDKGFDEVECGEETGQVYQGIFISAAELDFLHRHGPDAFEERINKEHEELWTVQRPSSV